MLYGLVEGVGTAGGITNPIVEIYDNSGTLTLRLLVSTPSQIWVYNQSEDALSTASYTSGLSATIAAVMGIPEMPISGFVTVQITKSDITEIAKI